MALSLSLSTVQRKIRFRAFESKLKSGLVSLFEFDLLSIYHFVHNDLPMFYLSILVSSFRRHDPMTIYKRKMCNAWGKFWPSGQLSLAALEP